MLKLAAIIGLLLMVSMSGCIASEGSYNMSASSGTTTIFRNGVVFFNEDYQVTPGSPVSFQVEVPAGAQNVELEISTTPVLGSGQAEVQLTACGAAIAKWGGGSNILISTNGWTMTDLCEQAEAGAQELSVKATNVPLTGKVLLRADIYEVIS